MHRLIRKTRKQLEKLGAEKTKQEQKWREIETSLLRVSIPDYKKHELRKPLWAAETAVIKKRHELQFYESCLTAEENNQTTEDYSETEDSEEMVVEEQPKDCYEDFQVAKEEARMKYDDAFEPQREKEKRKGDQERAVVREAALASHHQTRVEGVFPFLKQAVVSRPEELALKMMVEEPHRAKAKTVPLLAVEVPVDEKLEKKKMDRWNREIVAVASDHEMSADEEMEEPKQPEPTEESLLGKRVPLTEDLFSPEDREYLEYVLKKRLENSALTWDENQKFLDIKMNSDCSGFIDRMLDYEVCLAEGRLLYEPPVYYTDLLGGEDIKVLPQDRKKFMPFVFRDWSKQAYDDAVRQGEHRNFLFESSPWMKPKPKLDIDQWKKNISEARLRQTQGDKPEEDRKSISEAQKKA